LVFDMMLLLNCYMHDFCGGAATGGFWLLRARREKARLLSSYNNSSSPRRGTDQLHGDW
jgi:hypothetical protein